MRNDMDRTIDWEYRYEMDFIRMPLLIRNAKGRVIEFLRDGANNAVCALYNKAWPGENGAKRFLSLEFAVRLIRMGRRTMMFITLPKSDPMTPMACSHIAITYNSPDYSDLRVFHVEHGGIMATHAIGEMVLGPQGQRIAHINYGEAYPSDDANIDKIWNLAFSEAAAV